MFLLDDSSRNELAERRSDARGPFQLWRAARWRRFEHDAGLCRLPEPLMSAVGEVPLPGKRSK
jgi:hypothetical protein